MTIEIKLVDRYEDEVFNGLITKHLESYRVFIPAWDISQAGDETFQSTGKTVRIGAFDSGVLIGCERDIKKRMTNLCVASVEFTA